MKKRKKGISNVRVLTNAAMLTALSIVIGMFCKTVLDFGVIRITFENFPIILSGMMFGPWVGAAVGVCADALSYMLSTQQWAISPIITLGAALVGFVSGAVSHYLIKKDGAARIVFSTLLAHLVGSVTIKSIGLFDIYERVYNAGWLVLWRIPLYLVIATLESVLLVTMYKNRNFHSFMNTSKKNKGDKNDLQ